MKIWYLALSLGICSAAGGADWAPASSPLHTRWKADVSPERVHQEYPRPQLVRPDWMNLNGLWQCQWVDDLDAPPFGQELPIEILVPFPVESALSGVMKTGPFLWYRRLFEVPASWSEERILCHFGAVDWEATVYVNEKHVGVHRGGYDAFDLDITAALSSSGPQELLVGVFDPTDQGTQPRGKQVLSPKKIRYTGSTGIWQTVWIEPVAKTHVSSLNLVPDVDRSELRVAVGVDGSPCTVHMEALDAGRSVASTHGEAGAPLVMKIEEAKLWSPETPHLYDLKISLQVDGQTVDSVESYFGMRKIEVKQDETGVSRVHLNNRPIFMMGPLDQGFWPEGLYTAPTDEALKYDIEMTKRLGFNMTRKHVKVEPDRWYAWCDRLGLLVWQDMPNGDASTQEGRDQFELELTRMVQGLSNHPSIVMWIIFNEGWGQFDTERLVQKVIDMDPGRLVNNASGWKDAQVGHVVDVHNYVFVTSPQPESKRVAVLGEFGGLGLPVEGHTWNEAAWGYRNLKDSAELTRLYVRLLGGVWQLKASPGLGGAVYTQLTDVETECNGLLTYDREVLKMDVGEVSKANRGEGTPQ